MRLFAPAKVNLALHVTGRRDDGYHFLDSLVVFAGVGDWLTLSKTKTMSLTVTGPRAAGVPTDRRNLVWRAAEWAGRTLDITLEKHLPHAGGIGGGSSDAAAVLRGLGVAAAGTAVLGADVPVCVHGRPCRMSGIGDLIHSVPPLPPLWIVLVNPGVEVPTGPVFQVLETVNGAPLPDCDWSGDFLGWLGQTRNDLEPAAIRLQPVIEEVLARLRDTRGCRFARMSGSGATCFGLFATEEEAHTAAGAMPAQWWSTAAPIQE